MVCYFNFIQRFINGMRIVYCRVLFCLILIYYHNQVFGSFFSWKTRHVTIPALNDSRYIGLSVYIVFVCCTLGSLVAFIPSEQIQFSYFLRSLFIITCTTATVCLVFVPKVNFLILNWKKQIFLI